MAETVRLGVLGAGRGTGLAKSVKLAPSATLAAICDPQEPRLAAAVAATGVPASFTRYEDLLDADVDAIVVASPMPLHVDHSVMALRAGKHVLSEVTAATQIEQCWELFEAVRDSGLTYMMAENYVWHRPWQVVSGMVAAGLFGELYYGEAEQIQEFKAGLPPPETADNWRTAELAMRLGNHYITHHLGPICMAFGEPVAQVLCHGSGQRHLPWAVADSTNTVLAATTSGRQIRLRLDFFSDRPNNYLYFGLQGTGACYEGPRAPGQDHRVHIHGTTPRGEWQSLWDYLDYLPETWAIVPEDAVNDSHDGGAPVMIEAFARSILNGTPPPVDIAKALNWTAAGLLSEVSRAQGSKVVDVPEFR